jgi:hypothetical protein
MVDREVWPYASTILAGVIVTPEDIFLAERQALAVGTPDIAQQANDSWQWEIPRRRADDAIAHLHILCFSLQDHNDRPLDVAEVERLVGMVQHQYLDAIDTIRTALSAYLGFHTVDARARSLGQSVAVNTSF